MRLPPSVKWTWARPPPCARPSAGSSASVSSPVPWSPLPLLSGSGRCTHRQTTPRCGPILSAWLRRSAVISSSSLCRTTSSCTRAEGELKLAQDQLARVEPLLARQFVTEDQVEQARTKRLVAAMSVEQARTALAGATAAVDAARAQRHAAVAAVEQAKNERGRAQDTVGQSGDINARIRTAEVAVGKAALDLSYCRVYAPFSGRVVNLNISKGAFARAGADVFTLVDTATWYVVANFRETHLRHIRQGAAAEIYLQSQPNQRFHGTVVGLGWAVLPDSGASAGGLPKIDRQLDWVRLAQRFPVRLRLDNPDDAFRIGASAVVTIRDESPQAARAADR